MFFLLALALLCLRSVALVDAALFILDPFEGSTCQGGLPCNVSWIDDGVEPLRTAIGVSTVALYRDIDNRRQQLIKNLPAVNVGTTSYLTFTPLPEEGPNSDDYYIIFTSTKFNVTKGIPYRGYSAFFRLSGMSGSSDSSLPAATSSIPIPQSIQNPSTSSRTSTITVGTLSTSLSHPSSSPSPTPSVTPSVSGFSTSITPISSVSSTTSSASAPDQSNGSSSHRPRPLSFIFLALFSSLFFS